MGNPTVKVLPKCPEYVRAEKGSSYLEIKRDHDGTYRFALVADCYIATKCGFATMHEAWFEASEAERRRAAEVMSCIVEARLGIE
jgi:hypothetical protein